MSKRTRKEAGSMGGRRTLALYGAEHFREIGRRGALVTWKRYALKPVNLSDFAMVDKTTGEVKAYIKGQRS